MPPSYAHDQKPFVIVALPRTGSTLLTSLLDSHPQIICHNEPFNPDAVYASHRILRNEYMRAYREEDPIRFIDLLFSESRAQLAVGFKMLDYQAPDVQDHLLQRSDVRKLYLRRANLLSAYSSDLVANRVEQWRVLAGEKIRQAEIEFVPREFDEFLKHAAEYERHVSDLIERSDSPVMALEYGELLNRKAQKKLLAFLCVDPTRKLETNYIRQNPGGLRKRFTNWDRVVATLAGTPMEAWLRGD